MLQVDLSKTHGVTNEASEETKRASKSRHEVEQVEPSSSACGWAARVRFNLYEDKGLCESLAVLFWFTKNCIYPSPCAGQCAIFETNFQDSRNKTTHSKSLFEYFFYLYFDRNVKLT